MTPRSETLCRISPLLGTSKMTANELFGVFVGDLSVDLIFLSIRFPFSLLIFLSCFPASQASAEYMPTEPSLACCCCSEGRYSHLA